MLRTPFPLRWEELPALITNSYGLILKSCTKKPHRKYEGSNVTYDAWIGAIA